MDFEVDEKAASFSAEVRAFLNAELTPQILERAGRAALFMIGASTEPLRSEAG